MTNGSMKIISSENEISAEIIHYVSLRELFPRNKIFVNTEKFNPLVSLSVDNVLFHFSFSDLFFSFTSCPQDFYDPSFVSRSSSFWIKNIINAGVLMDEQSYFVLLTLVSSYISTHIFAQYSQCLFRSF